MNLRVYLFRSLQGQQRAVTLEQLQRSGFLVKEITEENGVEIEKERVIASEEEVSLGLPDGNWHTLQMIEEFTGEHDEKLEVMLLKLDKKRFDETATRPEYYGALAQIAVLSWDLPYSKDAEGFRRMPGQLMKYIGSLIDQYCFPPMLTGEDFTKPSLRK